MVLGGPFGTVVTFTLCGQIISAFGWKAAYYVTSGLILIFYVLWIFLIYDTPDVHPRITKNEKDYIKEQIGTTVSKQKVSKFWNFKLRSYCIQTLYIILVIYC